ncbi:hypothetical protein ZWY2020_021442 [Hordeum vulgare]|nr:hypothetical protein ZWY2020_021442 [Hordeum vulgare]
MDDMVDSYLKHSSNGEDVLIDAHGQEDYNHGEVNLDDFYVRGSGYASVPGVECNLDKGTDEEDTDEYSPEEEVEVNEHVSISKKERKPRSLNSIGTDRLVVTRVNETGEPVSPWKATAHYDNALGVILREVSSIGETNLRDMDKANLRELLLRRVHTIFKFPNEYDNLSYPKNQVNNHAIHKFSKNLSSWKSTARKELSTKPDIDIFEIH